MSEQKGSNHQDVAACEDPHKYRGIEEIKKAAASVAKLQKQAGEQQASLVGLIAQKAELGNHQACAADQALHEKQVSTVKLFLERADLLRTAANMLQQGIEQSRQQVLATNEVVLEVVNERFHDLCALLLPSMRFQLVKLPGQCASQGLRIQFQRLNLLGGKDSTEEDWSSSLEQLSGGQRTLISLALLLAVAQHGQRSSLFLLDEVDAALDEHNQAAVARLLHALAVGGGVQVLCVSHNVTFHKMCDLLVTVSSTPSNTKANTSRIQAGGKSVQQTKAVKWGRAKRVRG
eukprot:gene30713-35741_t